MARKSLVPQDMGGLAITNLPATPSGANDAVSKSYADEKVAGDASSTNNALLRWDGTTGSAAKNSSVTVSDGGYIDATGVEASDYLGVGVGSPGAYAEIYGDTYIYDGELLVDNITSADSTSVTIKDGAVFNKLLVTDPVDFDIDGTITTDTINEHTTDSGVTIDGTLIKDGNVDGRDVSADGSKLDGIESGAEVNTVTETNTVTLTNKDVSGSTNTVAFRRVIHGATASTARPNATHVEWVGSIAPTNADTVNDTWIDVS